MVEAIKSKLIYYSLVEIVQSFASLGKISGVNFIALAMFPFIFIFPYEQYYIDEFKFLTVMKALYAFNLPAVNC